MARRFLVPLAVLMLAAALGTFVLGRTRISASSPLIENPGMKLAASVSQTQAQQIAAGRTLFTETCSTCHGGDAQGSHLGPSLLGLGAGWVDLWLEAGWMPLKTPEAQPEGKAVILTKQQIADIVAYVTSLRPGGVGIPDVNLAGTNVAEGFDMFSLNCAPCHTITGAGDALAYGAHAPSLHNVTARMIIEAIRTGPSNMPRFAPGDISDQQALNVAAFVTRDIEHPANIGGIGLGGVGPVAEGFVGLFIGVGVCLLAAYWVGDRTDPDAYDEDAHAHLDGQDHDPDSDAGRTGDADHAEHDSEHEDDTVTSEPES